MSKAMVVLRRMRAVRRMGAVVSSPMAEREMPTAMSGFHLASIPSPQWSYTFSRPFSILTAALVGGGGGGGGGASTPPGGGGGVGGASASPGGGGWAGGASPGGGGASAPTGGWGGGGGSSPGGGSEAGADQNLCYTVGKYGLISFNRSAFVPLDAFLAQYPLFVDVPSDRLIDPVNSASPYFTSATVKEWIRSGFLATVFAQERGLTVTGALAEGNVGVIRGTNLLVFLQMKIAGSKATVSPNTPSEYPFTPCGFADYLDSKLKQVSKPVPGGLQDLLKCARSVRPDKFYMVSFNPEFLSMHGKYLMFIEVNRLVRMEMTAQNQHELSNRILFRMNRNLLAFKASILNDTMLRTWLINQRQKVPKGLPGMLALNVPPGSVFDLTKLTAKEHRDLLRLVTKAYSLASSPAFQASNKPRPSAIVEVHRHTMAHIVEDRSMAQLVLLPNANQASFRKQRLQWQDGVMLLDHRCPRYLHICAEAFDFNCIWDRLCLKSRLPIPQALLMPSNVKD